MEEFIKMQLSAYCVLFLITWVVKENFQSQKIYENLFDLHFYCFVTEFHLGNIQIRNTDHGHYKRAEKVKTSTVVVLLLV